MKHDHDRHPVRRSRGSRRAAVRWVLDLFMAVLVHGLHFHGGYKRALRRATSQKSSRPTQQELELENACWR